MNLREKMQRRLKLNRPSLRARARPPKLRTPAGAQFTAANLALPLALQHCRACGHVQYPPTEICGDCLGGDLVYRDTPTGGTLLARTGLHHSVWEFFKRRIAQQGPWIMGSVKLDAGPVALVHLGDGNLKPGDRVQVFSHTDASQSAVLIAVADGTDIATPEDRHRIVSVLGLTEPALREGGI